MNSLAIMPNVAHMTQASAIVIGDGGAISFMLALLPCKCNRELFWIKVRQAGQSLVVVISTRDLPWWCRTMCSNPRDL